MRCVRTLIGVTAIVLLYLLAGCATSMRSATDTEGKDARTPVAWGTMSPCNECVIFREYKKTKVGFWVVAVTSESHGELEVIETDGPVFEPKVWIENQSNMNELQHRAIKDKIRYVKIPDDYTPKELEAARALCRMENLFK